MFVRALSRVSVLAALLGANGCDDPAAPETPQDMHYDLVMFHDAENRDGVAVPGVLVQSGAVVVEILTGSFVLGGDETCSGTFAFRFTNGPDVTNMDHERACTWTQSGSEISFTWSDSRVSTGSLVADRLTVMYPPIGYCVRAPCPGQWTAIYERATDI
jgi:hypothetical protein